MIQRNKVAFVQGSVNSFLISGYRLSVWGTISRGERKKGNFFIMIYLLLLNRFYYILSILNFLRDVHCRDIIERNYYLAQLFCQDLDLDRRHSAAGGRGRNYCWCWFFRGSFTFELMCLVIGSGYLLIMTLITCI